MTLWQDYIERIENSCTDILIAPVCCKTCRITFILVLACYSFQQTVSNRIQIAFDNALVYWCTTESNSESNQYSHRATELETFALGDHLRIRSPTRLHDLHHRWMSTIADICLQRHRTSTHASKPWLLSDNLPRLLVQNLLRALLIWPLVNALLINVFIQATVPRSVYHQ